MRAICDFLNTAIITMTDRAVMVDHIGLIPAFLANRYAVALLITSIFLASCFSDTDDNDATLDSEYRAIREEIAASPEVSLPEADKETDSEKERPRAKVLDLSLPESIPLEEWNGDPGDIEPPNVFGTENLFSKGKNKKNLSVTVTPNLKPGEELTDAPEIDGGSIGVKVKTE